MSTIDNPYLQGNFAPVQEEVSDLECAAVAGAIPRDFAGTFLRIGPNPQFAPLDAEKYHPFDGDGMLHQLRFDEGRALYGNRWVCTKGLEREREEGKALWSGFLSLADMKHPPDMPMKNLANTAVVWHARRLLALWEAGNPYEISLPEMATLGEDDFGGKWQGSFTAHPTVDPRTGEMVIFGYSPFGPHFVHYGVLDANGKLVHETGIELPKPVMIHDIAITSSYSLILDMPVTFSIDRALSGGMAFDWEPENGARIGILPRHAAGDQIRWFDVDLGFIFHTFNAFEEGDEVVLDACRAKRTRILAADDEPLTDQHSRFHQYRFNLKTGAVRERVVSDIPLEFSRINEGYTGVRNRYGYACRFADNPKVGTLFTAVLKYDRDKDSIETYELGDEVYTQEFVFAPRADSRAEDDGYLVGLVRDEKRGASECWVIDAAKLAAGPVARVAIPTRVPYGFHSGWVAASDIARQRLHLAA